MPKNTTSALRPQPVSTVQVRLFVSMSFRNVREYVARLSPVSSECFLPQPEWIIASLCDCCLRNASFSGLLGRRSRQPTDDHDGAGRKIARQEGECISAAPNESAAAVGAIFVGTPQH